MIEPAEFTWTQGTSYSPLRPTIQCKRPTRSHRTQQPRRARRRRRCAGGGHVSWSEDTMEWRRRRRRDLITFCKRRLRRLDIAFCKDSTEWGTNNPVKFRESSSEYSAAHPKTTGRQCSLSPTGIFETPCSSLARGGTAGPPPPRLTASCCCRANSPTLPTTH